jgi:hypothetical protein
VKALKAEFEMDEGMEILPQGGGGIVYRDRDDEIALTLHGIDRPRTPAMTTAHADWWARWHAKPRPLVLLHNPFLHPDAIPRSDLPRPSVVLDAPERLELGQYMSPQLPGLGGGWSLWPFTGPDGQGLLAIAPNWFDSTTARAAVEDAGGADLPVLVAIRGQEPPVVVGALREARAETTYDW